MRTILIRLVLVLGPYSIDPQDVEPIWRMAQEYFTEAGIPVKAKFSVIQDPCPGLNSLETMQSKFYCEYKSVKRRYRRNKRTNIHFIIPPIISNGTSFIGGFSAGICQRPWGFSQSNAILYRLQDLQPRSDTSAVAIAHEIAHSIGATHTPKDTTSLMHPDAGMLQLEGNSIFITARSIKEIKKCQNGRLNKNSRGLKANVH